ncbi:putative phosphatidylinositol N-acetylglucosaminyltransferase subunit C [Apostichopus japonicus]|uniref:Putative phosphatidylinositol N-acetylglucosaminyltransferase subunit C n=1 Tax=Stichopus japonicus TaxID=307972 RepID=A0A2G8JKT2_STIJA|nr:putative phosphatidylinositol N-acetylglucosaminyltransferase subunit C [Apostichopus japonicus]
MSTELAHPATILTWSLVTTAAGFIIYDLVDKGEWRKEQQRSLADNTRSALIFIAYAFGLSPVLQTLTDTVSTDTIYAMSVFMLLANFIFHDYGTSKVVVSKSLSLNASVFASVCLASRLPTSLHAFTTVSLALQLFALWPELRRKLKLLYPSHQVIVTWLCFIIGVVCLSSVHTVAAVVFTNHSFSITYAAHSGWSTFSLTRIIFMALGMRQLYNTEEYQTCYDFICQIMDSYSSILDIIK